MKVFNLKETCGGCPMVFEWTNGKGHNVYFRLRHGHAHIENETKRKTVVSANFEYGDGVCSWKDVVKWAKQHNLKLKEM